MSDNKPITAWSETMTAIEWLFDPRCRVDTVTTILRRINKGWKPEDAISLHRHDKPAQPKEAEDVGSETSSLPD